VAGQPESFVEVVASEFGFLVDRGFRSSVESDRSVLFESPTGVFVRVVRDPRERSISFRAGLVAEPRDALTETEFQRLIGANVKADFSQDDSGMRIAVERRARLLREHGERILSGDKSILDEAKDIRIEYTRRYTKWP